MAPIGQTFKSLHAVVIIGYGIEDGIRFYWIKNSHGRKWGSRGIGKVDASLFVCFARPIKPYMQQIGGNLNELFFLLFFWIEVCSSS